MVMHHQVSDCLPKRLVCSLQGQGHNERYNKISLSNTFSELMILLQLNLVLMAHHRKLDCHVKRLDCSVVVKVKDTVKVQNSSAYPSGWYCWTFCYQTWSRSGELRMQKLKPHLVRTQSLNVLPLKPGVGQYIAIHATLTDRNFFLAYFYPSGPFTCIFFQNLSRSLPCGLWLTHGSCVGRQNKIGQPAWCGFPCWVPATKKHDLWYDDLWNE